MKKITVVFPGVGYTKDRPLLYYAGKLAVKHGYELIHMDFSGLDWSKEKLKDQAFLRQALDTCLKKTEHVLQDIGDLKDAKPVFISKSIGTVVACAYAKEHGIAARQLCFSPLAFIGDYVSIGGAVLFYGDGDPFADYRDIERIAEEKDLPTFRVSGGNHSLETGDVDTDIDNLRAMMQRVEQENSSR